MCKIFLVASALDEVDNERRLRVSVVGGLPVLPEALAGQG